VSRFPLAINLLAYQCAWLACVFGAAEQRPLLGFGVALAALLWHLAAATDPKRELALIGIAAVVGAVFESGLLASGFVRAHDWIMMATLWAVFATTLNVALRALRRRYLLCAALAAIGAPLAYQAGSKLGALEWVQALPALLLISAGWALLLPLLMRVAQRFDGYARP
jgi:hypothetical protein